MSLIKVFILRICIMKLNIFNILVIVLFILVIASVTMMSCTKVQPHYQDTIFKKHSDFEGFKANREILDYSNKESNSAMDTNKQHLINDPQAGCKKIFGFEGIFCTPVTESAKIDTIGASKGSLECVGKSSGLSNSMGGLCLDQNQIKLLGTRGGNKGGYTDDIAN
jgi:hypothetical protein